MSDAVVDGVLGELRELGRGAELGSLELPELATVGPRPRQRPTRKAMLGRLFYVYGEEARLRPPIEWLQDPHDSRTWRYELHTLTWLKEALARHARGGDTELLAVARDVALDWARAHLGEDADGSELSEFAWYDMAVGLRAPYLAYVLRACLAEEMVDADDAELLLAAAELHGAELTTGSGYAAANNHGLFQDEGLYLLARLLPTLPAAPAWRELALNRMRTTLAETIAFEEGAHLEHSPAYQLAIVDLLARLAANVGELSELGSLLGRMRRTAAWQTTPRGRMVQLGDSDDLPAPGWAADAAAQLRGICGLPEAGQAFVRSGESYLAVVAAHHGPAHKHADDGGFVLIEGGRTILGDAGRWGYYEEEADRRYARSAAAHNVLTVDGEDFGWRGAEPYGSGLISFAEADGWYAVELRNPLLEHQGVGHRRAVLYLPGSTLLVVDELEAEERHVYERHFHFGPELEVEQQGGGSFAFTAKGVAGALLDFGEEGEASLVRGEEEPHRGWSYPGDRERVPVCSVRLRNVGTGVKLTAGVSLDGTQPDEPPKALRRLL